METPIADFLNAYAAREGARLHMPGHKGKGPLGCERLDITEVGGADALYEASGIIARSEMNATKLFGSGRSCYSTEGSSQCVRAMLYLALMNRPAGRRPLILAARNVHKSFVYAAALLDFDIKWLWPLQSYSLCACPVSAKMLETALSGLCEPPAAVYITSPDYLGNLADVRSLAEVCHRHDTILAVDNAHGAYLHFLPEPLHPLDLGADICCDSAHKTLPVLTGGAYLHMGKRIAQRCASQMKSALALFGSTSPSYLIMASLDMCNRYLAGAYRGELAECVSQVERTKRALAQNGWQVTQSDPLRLTIRMPRGLHGETLSDRLREKNIECEYADETHIVFMITPQTPSDDLTRLVEALGANEALPAGESALPLPEAQAVLRVREAFFRAHEIVSVKDTLGRICAAPTVACPPAIPIAVSGERITPAAMALFERYNVAYVDVVK